MKPHFNTLMFSYKERPIILQLMESHYHNHNHKINTMGQLKSLFTILFLIAMSPAVTFAGKIPAIIVFGDSTVDAGNNNYIPTVARSNFEPYGRDFVGGKPTGRFCNGKIATDFMSEALGLKPIIPAYLDPSYNISDFATGVTFASAATGYDNATSDVLVRTFLTLVFITYILFDMIHNYTSL